MDNGLITAIFGLIGVAVGALATGGTQLYLDRRKEQHSIARAKRLVSGELLQARVIIASVIERGLFPPEVDLVEMLPTTAWETHAADLAPVITEELWNQAVVLHAELLALRAAIARLVGAGQRSVLPQMIDLLRSTDAKLASIRAAFGAADVPFVVAPRSK